jgi:hypothetical protein
VAYTRYVHDIGNSEDWFALQVALAPCLIGYGDIARRLHDDPTTVRGKSNKYWTWIENYIAQDYVDAVVIGKGELPPRPGLLVANGPDTLERYAVRQSPYRIEQLVEIFIKATEVGNSSLLIIVHRLMASRSLRQDFGTWDTVETRSDHNVTRVRHESELPKSSKTIPTSIIDTLKPGSLQLGYLTLIENSHIESHVQSHENVTMAQQSRLATYVIHAWQECPDFATPQRAFTRRVFSSFGRGCNKFS